MKIQMAATGFDLTPDLQKYTQRKLKRLNRRLPRRLRAGASCHVDYRQVQRGEHKSNTCELTLTFGDAQLTSKETTPHMYAALDVAAVHLEQQLRTQYGRRRLLRGFMFAAVY